MRQHRSAGCGGVGTSVASQAASTCPRCFRPADLLWVGPPGPGWLTSPKLPSALLCARSKAGPRRGPRQPPSLSWPVWLLCHWLGRGSRARPGALSALPPWRVPRSGPTPRGRGRPTTRQALPPAAFPSGVMDGQDGCAPVDVGSRRSSRHETSAKVSSEPRGADPA